MTKEIVRLAACLAIAAALFLINLGGYDLWPPDEPRYALVAREMLDSGDYMLPRVNNQPYKEKPPLLFWLIAAASAPSGEVTSWSARVPSVVSGLVVLLFAYLLARGLFNPRVALWTVLILMTTQRVWWNARFGQIDMLLTACLTVGLYAFWRWERSRKRVWLGLFYGAVAAGLLAKGPGVLVFPVLFVLAWSWFNGERRAAWLHLMVGCAVCLGLYALWAVPAHIGFAGETQAAAVDTFASNMFRQTLGRFFLGVSHANWPWYYFTTLPVDWLPWTLFFPWVALWTWRHRREGPSMRLLLAWILPAFIFFCIAIGKRGVYLLPLYPAMAVLFSAGVLDFMNSDKQALKKALASVYGGILLLAGVSPLVLLLTPYREYWTPGLAVFGAGLIAFAFALLYGIRKGAAEYLHAWVFVSFVVVSMLSALFVFPVIDTHKSARGFCSPLRELAAEGVTFDLYSVGFAREEYVFYSRHFMKELYTALIPLEDDHGMGLWEMAQFQRDLARGIAKAVEKVPVENIAAISEEELANLQEAIHGLVGKREYSEELIEDFTRGLEKVSDEFFNVFDSATPAFLYVQENDWRWIYAIHPDIHGAVVLNESRVGSRHVLLIANPPGARIILNR